MTTSSTFTSSTDSPAAADDPRPLYFRALDWVADLAAAVPADRMDDPTPCGDYDVRTLLAHLVTTARRPLALVHGTDPMALPTVGTDVPEGRAAETYACEVAALRAGWDSEEGTELLDRTVRVPWGAATGRDALCGYLNETLVHGWDVAIATGQDPEADPDLAEAAMAHARRRIPAQVRGGEFPFGPVVDPAPDAGPTERLANWSGHHR